MRKPPRRRRTRAPAAAPAGDGTIALSRAATRLAGLLAEQRKLLARTSKRRGDLERLEADIRAFGARIADAGEPLYQAMAALDREIHTLFAELLARGRLPARAAREIRAFYQALQADGVITEAPRKGARATPPPELDDDDHDEPLPSAPPPPDGDVMGQLKGIFRALARLLHPDRNQGGDDAHERSAAMKEVNRAYEARDLARLLELERQWSASGNPADGAADVASRCEALERTNRELLDQYRQLDRSFRALARSELGQVIRRLDRHTGKDAQKAAVDAFLHQAEEQRDDLQELRDFVRAFRDGQIGIEELLEGPGESFSFDTALDFLTHEIGRPPSPPGNRARR